MLQVVERGGLLYPWLTVENFRLVAALLHQPPHFSVLDWIFASLAWLAQCRNILSLTSQVYLRLYHGVTASFFFEALLCDTRFGLLTDFGNGCRQPPYVLAWPGPLDEVFAGLVNASVALD